jgi:alpha-beta hydrolase superfamily lysophospholipase
MRRGTQQDPWPGETAVAHGRVAVIGRYPELVRELRARNISVAVLNNVKQLQNRRNRDDVVVAGNGHSVVAEFAPRAEFTVPEDLERALRRAGIAPSPTPPRQRFSHISGTRAPRW